MKIVELTKQINVAVTNEEADMLSRFDEETPVMAKSDMDERQQLMANQLVNKNLLTRRNENGRITYKRRNR
jgi:pheromone shutdown protein TraB